LQQGERSAVLKLLGVDVWVQRPAPGELPEPSELTTAVSAAATPSDKDAITATTAHAQSAQSAQRKRDASSHTHRLRAELTGSAPGAASSSAAAIAANEQPPSFQKPAESPVTSAEPDIGQARVLSLHSAGLLLLADVAQVRSARRLVKDLLQAGTGDWSGKPAQTVFAWPPEQTSAAGISGRRALLAFVDKQLDDLGSPGALIVCERVLEMLPGLVDSVTRRGVRYLSAPRLQELMQNGEAKRDLWLKIQQLNNP